MALLLLSGSAQAVEPAWPQFRGPDSNPIASNARLPERWSTTENVEWSAEIPGRGWSSPIVAEDLVFLTTAVTEGASKVPQVGTEYSNEYIAELLKEGLSEPEAMVRLNERDIELPDEVELHYYLYALDLETGKVRWQREIYAGRPPGGRHRKNSFMSETPVTDGEFVYVYVANLGLYAYDLEGKHRWTRMLKSHPISLDMGTGASPALHEGRLIIVNDNDEQQFIVAFDKATGEELWRTDRDLLADGPRRRSGWATPYVWSNSIRTELVTVGPGHVVSYDLEGTELWRLSGATMVPVPMPFAYNGLLYVDAGRTSPLFALRPGASGDITPSSSDDLGDFVAWVKPRAGTYLPTPVAYNDAIYVLNNKGILSRFDAASGDQTYKGRVTRDDNAFTSSPWAYNGKVFSISETGNTDVVAAAGEFEVLHVNPLDEMVQASPAIVGDRLLIRTETRLYSLRERE